MAARQKLDPITPGEILAEEFMKPMGLSINRLARDLDIGPARVSDIVNGKRGISADTALRLARYFGTSAEMWLSLQANHDLRRARREAGAEITKRVRVHAAE
jgi:addiction module HigA family antidote